MNLYKKMIAENPAKLEAIEAAAAEAIDYAAKYYEFAVASTNLTEEGVLELEFVEGQGLSGNDIISCTVEAQKNFDEKFAELIHEII